MTIPQRRREIGIRLALGATDRLLIRHAVGGAMTMVAAGIAAGVALSILIVRLSSASFFGVSATDPVTYGIVTAVLAAVAWFANYYPARRIMRSTPYAVLLRE
ncbi:MAG: FtsX-like permease family protein [Bryobacteraceae bacterium]